MKRPARCLLNALALAALFTAKYYAALWYLDSPLRRGISPFLWDTGTMVLVLGLWAGFTSWTARQK